MASSISMIYVNRLIAGSKKFEDVPENRKEEVKQLLDEKLKNGELNQRRYNKILGIEEEQ